MKFVVIFSKSRERHISAPHIKLKNFKMTSKCQVFSSKVPEQPSGGLNWRAKRGTLWDFSTSILLQNIKIMRVSLKMFRKSLSVPEEVGRGGPFSLVRFLMSGQNVFECLSSVPWANRTVWFLNLCRTFRRTHVVSSCGLKNKTLYRRVSLQEALTKK